MFAVSASTLPRPAIRVLPDDVISRIAAGEVIERPASVIKELVENALDAKATRIAVAIREGGRTLIRVADDGLGLSPEDLALAIQRHATSKLQSADDLYALVTLGFRGEALPSIGSVSHLTLTSRPRGSEAAWAQRVENGRALPIEPAASNFGTSVEVRELFQNLPARLKFLKGDASEASACADTLLRIALTRPDVAFSLHTGASELFDAPSATPPRVQDSDPWPAAALRTRAGDLIGRTSAAGWVEAFSECSGPHGGQYRLYGLVSPPAHSHPNRSAIYLTVNNRPVKDRTLTTAFLEAYRHLLPPKRFPAGVLYLDLPGADVDVNVHPTKAEVRFRTPGLVFSLFHQAIRGAFGSPAGQAGGGETPARTAFDALSPTPTVRETAAPYKLSESPAAPSTPAPAQRNFDLWQGERTSPLSDAASLRPVQAFAPATPPVPAATLTAPPTSFDRAASSISDAPKALAAEPIPEPARTPPPPYRILGQAGGAYIVLEDEAGVKVIDQHALHERILFETLRTRHAAQSRADSQGLLVPEPVDLTPAQAAAFDPLETRELLASLGFDLEPFGPRTLLVRAVPAVLKAARAARLVVDLLEGLAAESIDASVAPNRASRQTLRERAAYILSCKGAIKAGERLTAEQMAALMSEYHRVVGAAGFTCPHGRPLAVDLTWETIARQVGR